MTQILGLAGSLRSASSSKAVLRTLLDRLPGGTRHDTAELLPKSRPITPTMTAARRSRG